MNTVCINVDEESTTWETLEPAIKIIQQGGLVAFPTETVYGLGADALDEMAAKKIYAAKGRPSDNPLIVHIAEIGSLKELAVDIPESAYQLANAFWPGPLTMILKKRMAVPYGTTGGLNTVAIRMPDNPIALELIKRSERVIAAPSANSSGKPSPTLAKHVKRDLSGKIDMIVDGGRATIGLESTIVDLTSEVPLILRPGYITKEMLQNIIGQVEYDKAVLQRTVQPQIQPKAPGMKYKHYAPEGDLTIYEGSAKKVVEIINKVADEAIKNGKSVGIIATDETKEKYQHGIVKVIGSRYEDETIASGLYAILREFDELGTQIILSESFYEEALGQAIMNRLMKASGYKIISVDKE